MDPHSVPGHRKRSRSYWKNRPSCPLEMLKTFPLGELLRKSHINVGEEPQSVGGASEVGGDLVCGRSLSVGEEPWCVGGAPVWGGCLRGRGLHAWEESWFGGGAPVWGKGLACCLVGPKYPTVQVPTSGFFPSSRDIAKLFSSHSADRWGL